MSKNLQRREFLKAALLAGTATATTTLSLRSRPVLAARSPNEKLNLGCIGVANKGAHNINNLTSENIVALCDVDSLHLGPMVEKFPKANTYVDFRQMFDKEKNLDAVVVSTPDHTHAMPVVRALREGLDVYCEKPLAHSVYEVRQMRNAAAEKKAVTQMGTQIHAGDNYRRVVEMVQAGTIGDVARVHVWIGNTNRAGVRVAQGTPPETVDYDLWIGPAPMRPFHPSHFHFNWRYWWDFGGGTLADFGCHYMDLPFWALDLRYPTSVAAKGEKTIGGDNEVPDNMRVDYQFPARGDKPAVHMTWYHGDWTPDWAAEYEQRSAVLFEGTKGRLLADYGSNKLFGDAADAAKPPQTIPNSVGHWKEWADACRSRGPTTCNFDYSGALAEAVLLGNVSYRAGQQQLDWDGEAFKVTNTSDADAYLHREYRKGWEL
ncbi:MAG: gfo/Idh/MocA family oxidoreductase [Planctomycetota bacterium]|nr:MAG: gfo/Idh/MocA family oxidoreductase [Planctomycetota bacterium]